MQWTGLARHAKPPFGLAVVALELFPFERPIDRQSVQRLETQVLLGEPIAGATPVECRATDRHRARDHPPRGLIADKIPWPVVLAVGHTPLAVAEALLGIEQPLAGL